MVDSANTLEVLSGRLAAAGARNIYVCASHGLFTEDAMDVIDRSAVRKVVVCNTLPLPSKSSDKVVQVSVAKLLKDVILAEHFRRSTFSDEQEFEIEQD